jgi:predicted Holliday junction resolvase-like endonuclease
MKDLATLLKLKEENKVLQNEKSKLKTELENAENQLAQIIGADNSTRKVLELRIGNEKLRKDKIELENQLKVSREYAENRNQEILTALAKGAYGITFEDFVINLSESTYLKIPIDLIFEGIKEEARFKYAEKEKLKLAELEESIKKYERKKTFVDDNNKELKTAYINKLSRTKEDFKRRIEAEKEKYNRKLMSIRYSFNEETSLLMKRFDEKYIERLESEIQQLQHQIKKDAIVTEKIKATFSILKKEKNDLTKENNELSLGRSLIEKRLQNCQREIAKYINTSTNKVSTINSGDEDKISLSNNNDGSKGWHDSARENGKFGSLPSFDNYDDDYLDNSKEGFE